MRQAIGLQIADDDLRARIRLLQLGGQFVDEQRRFRALRAGCELICRIVVMVDSSS